MVESLLDEIDGLGETRRKALLAVFGSVTALKAASIDEISAVPGIGPKLAKVIFVKLIRQENIDTSTGEILDA
jgi:excinuclease ABC subunit C